jgi:hypothetical protein
MKKKEYFIVAELIDFITGTFFLAKMAIMITAPSHLFTSEDSVCMAVVVMLFDKHNMRGNCFLFLIDLHPNDLCRVL